MSELNFKSVPSSAPDKELQAYIYQQLQELEVHLVPNTQAAVMVELHDKEYVVKLLATTQNGPLQAQVKDKDVYTAVQGAKNIMLMQIDAIRNHFEDSGERSATVETLAHSPYLH